MSPATVSAGCGSGACGCAGTAAAVATIDGIALQEVGEQLAPDELQERAWGELLRQEAVRRGLLQPHDGLTAPVLDVAQRQVIEQMLEDAVPLRQPDESECLRYYEAHKGRFIEGRQVRLRHILFAVTEGVDVHKLAVRAEQALLELTRRDPPPGRFAELARELSNCPSSADGGDLGWVAPEECAEELAHELFDTGEPRQGMGLHPRLVHSRHGFHIVDVLGRKQGRQLPFAQVRERIAVELAMRSRATALHQYIRLLAGQARVEGVELEGAASPLVQ
jgi:peptidyl-prolyl cis-trans isomerase C